VPVFGAAGQTIPEGDPAFLAEAPAGPPTILEGSVVEGRGRRRTRVAPRDPDDYKGLSLARENKSLKLVRGR
jgi:hypothetical protein